MSTHQVSIDTEIKMVTLAEGLPQCEEIPLSEKEPKRCFAYFFKEATGQKNVRAYVRCSTDIQVDDGTSLQVQRSRIVKYCEEKKYNIQAIYEDRGISGAKDIEHRLGLKKLLDDVVKDDIVMVTEIDRLSRDFNCISNCEQVLKKKKCGLEIVGLGRNVLDKSSGTALVFHILASIGEEEREMISKRVKATAEYAKKMGTYKSKPSFGWKSPGYKIPNVPDEEEMKAVEYIRSYRKLHPGSTLISLINDLDINYPVSMFKPSYGSKSCKAWGYTKVKNIMKEHGIE
jgi:DNA invertase Pin-like site-specific DNA recombinase